MAPKVCLQQYSLTPKAADALKLNIQPSLATVHEVLSAYKDSSNPPNLVPICATIPADILTPALAYLKISAKSVEPYTFTA